MHVFLSDETQDWYLPPLTPVTEENGYTEEDWPEDGLLTFEGPGYRVDFNEYFNSGFAWEEVQNKDLSELLYIDEDVGALRIGAGDWVDPTDTRSFTVKGSYLRETIYAAAGDDDLHDNVDGFSEASDYGDQIAGGPGNDTYHVSLSATELYETLQDATFSAIPAAGGPDAGGVDKVVASVDWTLGQYFENLTLTGSALEGVGNGLANVIQGNEEANELDGLGGDDLVSGRAGADLIDAGDGSDVVSGGAGDDQMTGGANADLLVFRGVDGAGRDLVTGFTKSDAIVTDAKLFDSNNDGIISAGKDKQFAFGDGRAVKLTNLQGATWTKLEYDGAVTIDGVEFFVYSTVGSAGTLQTVQNRGFDLDAF